MCGIVGYLGDEKQVVPLLLEGLKRLEYRGYDSAGLALLTPEGKLEVYKEKGNIRVLENKISNLFKQEFNSGLAHTRWATHGEPSSENAHPHLDCAGEIAIVHNGIIENYVELRQKLISEAHKFESQTDTEVLVHLIEHYYKDGKDPEKALTEALANVNGTFGLGVIFRDYPDLIFAARRGSPLVIGLQDSAKILASDVAALIKHTDQVVYLKDNELAILSREDLVLKDFDNQILKKKIEKVYWSIDDIDKGEYPHYMLKEIHEQASTVHNAFRGRFDAENGVSHFGGLNLSPHELQSVKDILILACGTSWHAGLVGKYVIEKLAGIPVSVEYASEFRYRNAVLRPNTLVIAISQSGETADTLAALREAKRKGAKVLGVTNVIGSTIARETDGGIYLHAGPEIGVASTKVFTSQLVVLTLFGLLMGRQRFLSMGDGIKIVRGLEELPEKIEQVLASADQIREVASHFVGHHNALYLGRGINFPIALEGALKLKEISYIHAEGYPAAEMKHGPIALIDKDMPVVFLALQDSIYEKVMSNIEEVNARGGKVIAIASQGDIKISKIVKHIICIPEVDEILSPILSVIPMQLFAYYIAVERGCNVDQPKNLAKSVTVE